MQLPYKVSLAGLGIALLGMGFGWGIFPMLLSNQINKLKGLARGSETRDFWEKIPFTLDFKVYLFNVTNYRAVQELGDIPMLDEIGPYVFDEIKEKVDLIDFEEEDSVSFRMKNTFIFNKEKSAPLTGDESISMPHPLLTAVLGAVERDKPSVLGLVNSAIPGLFNQPTSIFFVGRAMDYLFDGTILNCTGKEFSDKAMCAVLKKEVKELRPSDTSNIFTYSIFAARNATPEPNVFKVFRGIKDAQKVGEMISLNGKKKLPYWKGRPCNDLVGTDSTIFPPGLKHTEPIRSYSSDVCRSLPAVFRKRSNYKGIEGLEFTVEFGDMSTDPSQKCFCASESLCLKKGAMDLMPCTGAPVMATLPHFYNTHEDYLKGVRGLHPNKDRHEIVFIMEPLTGTPVYAKKRMMFSIPLHKIKQINLTENLPSVVTPMFWVEESLELSDQFVEKIDSELFRIIRVVDIVKWLLMTCGSMVMVSAVGLYYKKKNSLAVTPTSTSTKRTESPDHYLENKKSQRRDLDMGHTNYGYM